MINKDIKGFKYIQSSSGIHEYVLSSNGLRVLIMEDHSAPVATVMVTYHVGSRNEANGHTGATHLLEHLMFKGSKNFNKEKGTSVWTVLQDIGAMINATTWMDRTNYFELVPSEHVETAIQIEADRMRNAFIRDEDRQSEMNVVRNEFERGENSPFQALDKLIWGTAYQSHPYHHPTIGWRTDIENVPTERLKEFYDTFYWPNNATATIIGDVDIEKTLKLIKIYFGEHGKSPHSIPNVYTEEPMQEGPRRVFLKRTGQAGIIGVGHKMPQGLHKDMPALQLLGRVLYGGKTSRFHMKLIEKGLATSVMIENFPLKDNGMFVAYAFLTPNTNPEAVEKIILDEYELIKKNGVTEDEIKKAKARIRSELAFSRDGSYSIASNLNEAIAMGDWTAYTNSYKILNKVSAEQIKQAVTKYLVDDQSTTGVFMPKSNGPNQPVDMTPPGPAGISGNSIGIESSFGDNSLAANVPTKISERVEKSTPIDGLDLYLLKTGAKDIISINGSLYGGNRFNPENNHMVAEMTATMLDQGTIDSSKYEISEKLENIGAEISFYDTSGRIHFEAHCLKENAEEVIELLAEQLIKPAFNAKDLNSVKTRAIGMYERKKENTQSLAYTELMQSMFPASHPNYSYTPEQSIEALSSLTAKDLKAFHKNTLGLGKVAMVVTGDVPAKKIKTAVKKAFGSWKKGKTELPTIVDKAFLSKGQTKVKKINDKTSADLYLGIPIHIDKDHPDYNALMVATFILGGNFSARMMTIIRDQMGLTYGVGSGLQGANDDKDGFWYTWGTFSPKDIIKGKDGILKVVKEWLAKGITTEELAKKKGTITGSYKVGMGTSAGLARAIISNVEQGRDLDYIDNFPNIINELTKKEVNDAIKKYINLERLHIAAAGTLDKL